MKKVVYYDTYEDDFVTNKYQSYQIKDNYRYIKKRFYERVLSSFYHLLFLIMGLFYSKLSLHVRIKNKKVLKGYKGYFVYANHTQALGDVFNPIIYTLPVHPYYICSAANLKAPVFGWMMPIAGALPISDKVSNLIKLKEAVSYYIKKKKCIIIYPEAHVWPYYTKIRDFSNVSFHFPVENNAPVFTATTVYTKSKIFKKPIMTIYLDGPFIPDDSLSRKEKIEYLHNEVYNSMVKYSKLSNIEYIKYEKNVNNNEK